MEAELQCSIKSCSRRSAGSTTTYMRERDCCYVGISKSGSSLLLVSTLHCIQLDPMVAFLKQICSLHVQAIAEDDAGLVLIHLWYVCTSIFLLIKQDQILPHDNQVHMLPEQTNDFMSNAWGYQLVYPMVRLGPGNFGDGGASWIGRRRVRDREERSSGATSTEKRQQRWRMPGGKVPLLLPVLPTAPPATTTRMDDYMANLNDASISLFGEGFVEAQEGLPPHLQSLA